MQIHDKESFVNQMFTRIANKYDRLNNIMTLALHKGWKQETIKHASSSMKQLNKAKILDLCTGTGDMAFMWAKDPRVNKVIAVDTCKPMLDVADDKLAGKYKKFADKITFMEGDAIELPFPDDTFDAVTVGFGLRNVVDLQAAIYEIYRVLKPEAYVASLDLGHPESALPSMAYKKGFLKLVPWMGAAFAKDKEAYAYLTESLKTWPTQKALSQMFWDSQFTRSYYKNVMAGTIAIVVAQK
jgi:demethylmenaquinone methyltransferase/2-methoxy-6-polyprenyl-1,4-benzoquinol methylase